jgi:hypothetical protein
MPIVRMLVLLLGLAGLASGCASGRAQVIEEQPTLAVPPVPPRSIETTPMIEPIPVDPLPDYTAPPASAPKPKPPARNNDPKPEPKPETPPETTTANVPNPPPVAPLRTATTPTGPEAMRQIREILQRAEAILSKVDYQKLGEDRRQNYDSAKNYIQQAEEKMKQADLTLAMNFANRAENIAKTLLETGRY